MNIRSLSTFLLFLGTTLVWISCSDDDDDPGNQNQAPGSFVVSVSNITNTSVTLTWTAATDPDGDDVSYELTVNGTSVQSGLTVTSVNLSGLTAATAYSGKVIASDGNGGSSSADFSFTTTDDTNNSPGSFTVTVSNITDNSASLSWTAATDPDGDNVTYAVTLGSTTLVTSQTGTTYTLTDLTGETAYNGTVTASDGNGGTSSANYSFTTEATVLVDPSFFTSGNFVGTATMVDCMLEDGTTTKCYQLTFISNPVPDGPYCPATTSDVGGMGIYEDELRVMNASLFNDIEADGFDIIDDMGNIRIQDPGAGGGGGNPNFSYCLDAGADDNLELTFLIPITPKLANENNVIESVELIGVSVDGVPINGDPPNAVGGGPGGGGGSEVVKIPSLDPCGGHQDPAGYYHWHFASESVNEVFAALNITEISCTNVSQDNTTLSGFAKDGYPIYASADEGGTKPTDLDECNGHTGPTEEFPSGVYHYHASSEAPNLPPCIKGVAAQNPFTVN